MSLLRLFFSFYTTITLLAILAIGAAVATFVENDFGAETAKALVYSARWYEIVLTLTTVNMIGGMYRYKMWRRRGMFLIHGAFVVIFIGAAMTRYFGYEGMMPIREGQTTNKMLSSEPYLQIEVAKDDQEYYSEDRLLLPAVGNPSYHKALELEDKTIEINLQEYKLAQQNGAKMGIARFNVTVGDETKEYKLIGTGGMEGVKKTHEFDGVKVSLTRGSKDLYLPFELKLRDFDIDRYPGSMSPSSYASEVTVIDEDNDKNFEYRIYMNHTLNYGGFKFFQSSYDQDEKGTVLSVNKDPGKTPTYIGYFLLTLGFLLNLFDSKSRFSRLRKYLKKNTAAAVLAVAALALPVHNHAAQEPQQSALEMAKEYTKDFKQNSQKTAKLFGKLVTQSNSGRMQPVNTQAIEVLNKISGKSQLYSMQAEQVLLGMMTAPEIWQGLRIIKVKHPALQKKLDAKEGYIAFNDAFSQEGQYILKEDVEKATRKDPKNMGTYDKDIIKLDERLNITYMVFNGSIVRLFPKPDDPSNTWYPPLIALEEFPSPQNAEVADAVQGFFGSVINADWERAQRYIRNIKDYQEKYGSEVIPSDTQIQLEILMNESKLFPSLTVAYVLIGLVLLVLAFTQVFKPSLKFKKTQLAFIVLLSILFALQTAGMGMRWYISGHAPWSDSYESMLYIAWSALLAGLLFFRNSYLALAGTTVMAAAFMFSAHLSWINPQITNLVPVLKSYWLTIHVSVITASYGFLGLGAILGFFALVLFNFRSSSRPHIDSEIKKITAINEMTVILGLSLFTVGNFLGGVWANESWGRYWGWDPKETWSYVLIVVYAIVIHLRFIKPLNNPYTFSVASLLAFSTVLMTYYGVNFYLSGMHSYASGDPVPIPTWVYVLSAVVLITIVTAFRKKDLPKLM
ncbi:MAG: cytochrome c biogenesis protein CcsA [Campylobacterota bacterium]